MPDGTESEFSVITTSSNDESTAAKGNASDLEMSEPKAEKNISDQTAAEQVPKAFEVWKRMDAGGKVTLSNTYLLDTEHKWSPVPMCHIFEIEKYEDEGRYCLEERYSIILDVSKHFKTVLKHDAKRPPRVDFASCGEVHVYCRTQKDLEILWNLPPLIDGVRMKRVQKGSPFPPYVYKFDSIKQELDERQLTDEIVSYVRCHGGLCKVKVIIARFYRVEHLFEDQTFAGSLYFMLDAPPHGRWAKFKSLCPSQVEYGRSA